MFPTSISSWALLVWQALREQGHDPDAVFKTAGLDPARLADPNARYSAADMQKLWIEADTITANPCFGLEVGKLWHPTTFHALGYAWLASSTLLDALGRLSRYAHIVHSAIKVKVDLQGASYILTIVFPEKMFYGIWSPIDAGIVAFVQMCREICGDGYEPQKVLMSHPRQPCCDRFEAFFRAPIQFNSTENGVVLNALTIEKRLPTANAELARVNEEVVIKYLSHLSHASIATQVKERLIERLPSGHFSETLIAECLNMSLRSLQRKLLEEGTSYHRLIEETRRDLAKDYVESSMHSINEIAYLLGFSAQANFTRAFRRWYDTSPSAYRESFNKTASVTS
jgi:AraC-like DNA-binding protein